MLTLFRQPRWIGLAALVFAVVAVFLSLGFWQLDRHQERRLENEVLMLRYGSSPEDLELLLGAIGDDVASLEYRRATVVGVFQPAGEFLLRSRVYLGTAGYGVVTPLVTDSGTTVLVDRGWVPLELDTPPVSAVSPPTEKVGVSGVVRASQPAGGLGPVDDPDGAVLSRVDLDLLAGRFDNLAPVWVQVVEERTGSLPVPSEPPALDAQGPHLSYAIQWFSFAIIGLVGFYFLARRSVRR